LGRRSSATSILSGDSQRKEKTVGIMQYKILESTRLNTDGDGDPAFIPEYLVGTAKGYESIKGKGVTSLQTMVREHMKEGWKPLGGGGSWGGEAQPPQFYQAMVKD